MSISTILVNFEVVDIADNRKAQGLQVYNPMNLYKYTIPNNPKPQSL